ncbi:MAG: aminotransferase class I/II-fold pyridoxal phosphate-dependent enzyme [Candidatus Marinimicrobia bacterium]|jgi:glycine C-acetyltransferase|nr:aminotransferase class I/II-fold pyridoxal phosphate-dependent enzyme [Candidatus Neomarinimicrobiota bacterium]MDP6836833.1 aminotransferase class I/II-fold pyridoxal phosphate-dependent enzyme [Candidatus Neomarinimicrobiota bacterium]|tara:strand:+ start:4804 stop:6099 length:1296 start_codon:yes stop_codon:yes gene_type:complete
MTERTDKPEITGKFTDYTLDMFSRSVGRDHAEIRQFAKWRKLVEAADSYTFEVPHLAAQRPEVAVRRETGQEFDLISFASYNYLGYSYHPDVLAAAKEALELYGLGATGSPLLNGTFQIHKLLEDKIVDFFGQDDYGVSLFSSGYGANVGVISAFIHKGDYVVLDRSSHASLIDGAILSQGKISLFRHNDVEFLEKVLKRLDYKNSRILVCCEGVYSTDGDYGDLKGIVEISKKYGATVLVDEAHSMLVAGENGRGVCEEQEVLDQVDMIIGTFSKSFGGVGGCLYARKDITNYVNYYARSRMFSCALDPAVTGGLVKALELAAGDDGRMKRKRIIDNANYLRSKLEGKVDIGSSTSWIVPVIYGDERLTLPLSDYLQREGIDISLMMFPAVPKNRSRIRAFVTSEHTLKQLDKGAEVLLKAAEKFNFLLE